MRILEGVGETHDSLVYNFTRCLPVPPPHASLDDLLEFKSANSDKLDKFWAALYGTAGEAERLLIPKEKEEMEKLLEDHLSEYRDASYEKWGQKLLASVKIRYSVTRAFQQALAAHTLGNAPLVSMAIGAFGGLDIYVEKFPAAAPISEEAKPFAYAFAVEKM